MLDSKYYYLEIRMMDKVQKTSDSERYSPSPEPFRYYPPPPQNKTKKKKIYGLSPRANYTDRAIAACRRSDCQILRIKGATWSA
jgi:hypothetical protein